jgi:GTP diphosphokinase / guanosine-3',5'-bis(diphosphate) 3'-diphosphatase
MDIKEPVIKYNLSEEEEKKEILRQYRGLLKELKPKLKPGDKELLRIAFEMAVDAHKTMRRKSGEPYILHPIAVAIQLKTRILPWKMCKGNLAPRSPRS